MALTGMSRFDTVPYVSNADPCKRVEKQPIDPAQPEGPTKSVVVIDEGATKFHLAPLDVFIMGRIYDRSQSVSHSGEGVATINTNVNQTCQEAVQFGLRGWDNFLDDKGQPIKFATSKRNVGGRSYTIVSDETMTALGVQLAFELGNEIKSMSEVKAAEAKN